MQATLFSSWCREAKISFWNHSGCTMSHQHKCLLLCRLKVEEMTTHFNCEHSNCAIGLCLCVTTICAITHTHTKKTCCTPHTLWIETWEVFHCVHFLTVKLLFSLSLCKNEVAEISSFWHCGYTKALTNYQQFQGCWEKDNDVSGSSDWTIFVQREAVLFTCSLHIIYIYLVYQDTSLRIITYL